MGEERSGELAQLLTRVSEVAGRRVHVTLVPERWKDAEVEALTRLVNAALSVGPRSIAVVAATLALNFEKHPAVAALGINLDEVAHLAPAMIVRGKATGQTPTSTVPPRPETDWP